MHQDSGSAKEGWQELGGEKTAWPFPGLGCREAALGEGPLPAGGMKVN